MYIYIYIYIIFIFKPHFLKQRLPELPISKREGVLFFRFAPKGNGIGAKGSNHTEQRKTRVVICTGVLRTRCPYSVALRGVAESKRGRVLLTEMLLPRTARQGTVCLISTGGQARNARIEKFELDEGFRPYDPPFRRADRVIQLI